jgi:hypothetical protein
MELGKAVLFGTGFLIACTFKIEKGLIYCGKQSLDGIWHMLKGTGNLTYSLANLATLGSPACG